MSTVATDTNGRLPDGTFGPGNRAASGHKRRQRMAELRAAFVQAVTPEAVQEIVATLVRQAKDGCPQSAKLVLDRALGKVTVLDSEDPPPDEQRTLTVAELGPITPENIEQHRAARLAALSR